MTTPELWQAQFEAQTHRTVESVLEPIAGERPEGENLRRDPIYREIQKGRECDDPSLPRGPWEGELKRADWRAVRDRALQALTKRSKDLQLLAWVLEAQIHLVGFAGVAPAVHLIERACSEYWDRLYPQTVDGDCDHRNNVFHAINEKLQPALRLVPLCAGEERQLCWADYVRAHRNQSLRTKGVEESQLEGPALSECQKLILATPAEHWLEVYVDLSAALASLERLRATLARLQPEETPSLGGVAAVLAEIAEFVKAELSQRGYRQEYDSELPPAAPPVAGESRDTPSESEPARPRPKASSLAPSRRPGERSPSIP
ncbi:MAG TPA: type VI secretion system protein TssA, partial [Polyangiaceae bacterium]|nr:type VI secretion system protein TssA [Polyangiaceae bacterium]